MYDQLVKLRLNADAICKTSLFHVTPSKVSVNWNTASSDGHVRSAGFTATMRVPGQDTFVVHSSQLREQC